MTGATGLAPRSGGYTTPLEGKLWIVGAGSHGRIVLAAAMAAGVPVGGVFDDAADSPRMLNGVGVTTPIPVAAPDGPGHLAMGSNAARRRLAAARQTWRWMSLYHPTAWVDPAARVGRGVLIGAQACVQIDSDIGDHAIINSGAIIEHDCVVGPYCHVAPGSVLAGAVRLGEGAFVGAGARLLPGLTIGAWAVVGAGAVVTGDVAEDSTVLGVPARPRTRREPRP